LYRTGLGEKVVATISLTTGVVRITEGSVQPRRRYTWNEEKRASNLLNHGIDFAIANDFEWETALEFQDTRRDYGEISLRKANGREIDRYEISQR
jgi:hypothetical protein